MSGPKYSEADLRRMEAERLEKERQEQLRLLRIALEEAKGRLKEEYKLLFGIRDEIHRLVCQISSCDDEFYVEKINNLLQNIKSIPYDLSGDKDSLEDRILSIKSSIEYFKKQLEELIYKNKENHYVRQIKTIEKSETQIASNVLVCDNQKFTEYYDVLEKCKNIFDISGEDKKNINSLAERLENLVEEQENLLEIDKTCKILKSMMHNIFNERDKKLSIYDDYVVKAITLDEKVRGVLEFDSFDELQSEIERLDNDIRENDKLEYISKVIEEVMAEFGHNIVRSDVIKTQTNSYQEQKFDFGDDGIIAVKQSSDGAIVMQIEVVGDDNDMSIHEKQLAMKKMMSFCSQYPEIAKRIEEKGVVFRQICNMPPEECFAKKINRNEIDKKNKKTRRRTVEKVYKDMQHMRNS